MKLNILDRLIIGVTSLSFCDEFISLSVMSSRHTHFLVHAMSSFFLKAKHFSVLGVHYISFIHASVLIQHEFLLSLAIVSNKVVNIDIHT